METNTIREEESIGQDDACEISLKAALSVIKEQCASDTDEEDIDILQRKAEKLLQGIDPGRKEHLQEQIDFYKQNNDPEGMLRIVNFIMDRVSQQ